MKTLNKMLIVIEMELTNQFNNRKSDRVFDVPHRTLGCACANVIQERTWGALIGACALNRANTVSYIFTVVCLTGTSN